MKFSMGLIGIIAGYFIGRLMSLALYFIGLLPATLANISGDGANPPFLLYFFSVPIAILIALLTWLIGNALLSAFLPQTAIVSVAISTLMALYTGAIVLLCIISVEYWCFPPFWM